MAIKKKLQKSLKNINSGSSKIDLRSCDVDDADAVLLAEAVASSRKLKVLQLSKNAIGNGGCTALAQALEINKSIEQVNLDGNRIEEDGGLALLGALQKNSSVKVLSLWDCNIPEAIVTSCYVLVRMNREKIDLPKELIQVVPQEVQAKGSDAILAAMKRLAQEDLAEKQKSFATKPEAGAAVLGRSHLARGTTPQQPQAENPSYRCKLIVLGQGAVGKTTLIERLRSGEFAKPTMTDGIDVSQWVVPVAGGQAGSLLELSVWDFGGQTEYYTTHTAFLSLRTVYLLVWNADHRVENIDPDGEFGLQFWLGSLSSYVPSATVIVVGTHALDGEARKLPLSEKDYRKLFPHLDVRPFHVVDSASGFGIGKLQNTITEAAMVQKGVADRIPKAWLSLRARVVSERRNHAGLPFVPLSTVHHWASEYGIVDAREQEIAVSYLNDTSVLILFHIGNGRVVIDPEWLPRMMSCIVTANPKKNQHIRYGVLKRRDLFDNLWKEYPNDTHNDLLVVLERFEIIFPLDRESELLFIPSMLPREQPLGFGFIVDENKYPTIHKMYECSFLPEPFFSKLLFRCYRYIRAASISSGGQHEIARCWRNGAILRKNEHEMIVEVRRSKDRSAQISLSCRGPVPANFLAIVSGTAEALVAEEFEGVNLVPQIACPECLGMKSSDVGFFSLERIRKLQGKGKRRAVCHTCEEDVSMERLIADMKDVQVWGSGQAHFGIGRSTTNLSKLNSMLPADGHPLGEKLSSVERDLATLRSVLEAKDRVDQERLAELEASARDVDSFRMNMECLLSQQRGMSWGSAIASMPRVQLEIMQRELLETLTRVMKVEIRRSMQFTANLSSKNIPTLFCVLPEKGSVLKVKNWGRNTYRVFLLCECGGCGADPSCEITPHHFTNHVGYKIRQSGPFLQKFGPAIKYGLQIALQSTSISGFSLPSEMRKTVGHFFEDEAKYMKDLLQHVGTNKDSKESIIDAVDNDVVRSCMQWFET